MKMQFATSLDDDGVKHFFEAELGMPEATVSRLAEESAKRPDDLIEFATDNAKTIIRNLRSPCGRVPDEVNEGRSMPTQVLKLGIRASLRSQNSEDIMNCYDSLEFQGAVGMLVHDPVIKNFTMGRSALI